MIRERSVNPLRNPRMARIAGLICLVVLIGLIFYFYHEGLWRQALRWYKYLFELGRLQSFIMSFGPFAALVFIILQALQVVFAPIPGELTGFVGGLLFGKVAGTFYSTIGLTLGSLAAFGIARRFGASFVHKIVKKEYIDRFDYFVTHRGLYVAFILFLVPGFPKDSLCYLLGLTRLRFLDFLLMNLFGRLPGTLMLGLQGDAVRNKHYVAFWVLLLSSVILVAVMYVTRNHLVAFFHNLWAYGRLRLRDGRKARVRNQEEKAEKNGNAIEQN
jgi:uncharacterized membrane protein YdjX (TVP38/TMEM64 family)